MIPAEAHTKTTIVVVIRSMAQSPIFTGERQGREPPPLRKILRYSLRREVMATRYRRLIPVRYGSVQTVHTNVSVQ